MIATVYGGAQVVISFIGTSLGVDVQPRMTAQWARRSAEADLTQLSHIMHLQTKRLQCFYTACILTEPRIENLTTMVNKNTGNIN